MYDVRTDHQVVAFGTERMELFDCTTGGSIALAERDAESNWHVTAEGADPVVVAARADAVMALTEQALVVLPGTGYSTTVPHGLMDMP